VTVLLTGERGSGKTRACLSAAAALRRAGLGVGGLVSPAVFADGVKTAIDADDLSTGQTWRLADAIPGAAARNDFRGDRQALAAGRTRPALETAPDGGLLYGMWRFDPAALARADAVAASAVRAIGDRRFNAVFVDELGPLEFDFGVGLTDTLQALDEASCPSTVRPAGGRMVAAVIVVTARVELAPDLAVRWGADYVWTIGRDVLDGADLAAEIQRLATVIAETVPPSSP